MVLVVSCDKNGKSNIIPLGWAMPTSHNPPMVAISVGNTRYSHKLISETKEFVLAFPSEDMTQQVLFCGTHSGKDVDKFEETRLTPIPAKLIKPPLIAECIVNFECKVVSELKTGDHTIFCGKILKAYVSGASKKRLYTLGHDKSGKYIFGGI